MQFQVLAHRDSNTSFRNDDSQRPPCRNGPPALVSEHRRQPAGRLRAHCRADRGRDLALAHSLQSDRCGDEPPDRGQSAAGPIVARRRSQDRRAGRAGDRAQQGGKRGATLPAHGEPVRSDRPALGRPEQAAEHHLRRGDGGAAAAAGRRDQHQCRRSRPLDPRDSPAQRSTQQGDRQGGSHQRGRAAPAAAGHGRYPVPHRSAHHPGGGRPDRYAGPATRACVAARCLCGARRFQSGHHPAQRDRDGHNSRCPAGIAPATRRRYRQPVTKRGDAGIGCSPARGRPSRRCPIAGCPRHRRRRIAGDPDQTLAGTAGCRLAAGSSAGDRRRSARAGFEAQRERRARGDQHRGAVGAGDRRQPAVAHHDRGYEPHPRRSDRLAVRAALRRAAADRSRDRHAGDRPRRPGDPASAAQPRRAGGHGPDARRIPRQCPRHPRRQGRSGEGARRSRGRLAHEVGVPRQYEPRAAHAAQRHHRLQRNPGRGRDRPRRRYDGRRSAEDPGRRPAPAGTDQRHPRSFEDRSRPDGRLSRADLPRAAGRGGPRHHRAAGEEERQHARDRMPARYRLHAHRSHQAQAEPDQPAQQRGEIHPERARDPGTFPRAGGIGPGAHHLPRIRYRHRHERGAARPPVPGLHPGRQPRPRATMAAPGLD